MASSRQVAQIMDDLFCLAGAGRYHAQYLRGGGLLPATPGKPEPLAPGHIAALLLSVLLGSPCAVDHTERVKRYAALRGTGGPTLGQALAAYIVTPWDFFELKIDLRNPSATITFRGRDRGMATIVFEDETAHHTGAERHVTVDGNTFVRLAAAIAEAPEVRAGRRPNNRKLN